MAARTTTTIAMASLVAIGAVISVCMAQSGHFKGVVADADGRKNALTPYKQSVAATKTPMTATPEEIAHIHALSKQAHQRELEAHAQMDAGDLAGAEQSIKQAISFYKVYRPEFRSSLVTVAAPQRQFLGDIYLKEGRYQDALSAYGDVGKYTHGEGATNGPRLSLNVALAYCGLGDYASARRYFSDSVIRSATYAGKSADSADLPDTTSPQGLEASILLARGLSRTSDDQKEKLDDYRAAAKLLPDNPVINYHYGFALREKGLYSQAADAFRVVTQRGHSGLAEAAQSEFVQSQASLSFFARHPNYHAEHPSSVR